MNWMRSDQLLLGWLFSTIDKEVLAQVIHCESSAEVWMSLESLYSRQTIAKSFQLKQQPRSTKNDALSINDYILKIKTIGHSLAAIGEPFSDKDLLLAILNGLDHEYETVVSLITYQMDEIDIEKVQYLLLMHEQRLQSKNVASVTVNAESVMSSPMHVNMTAFTPRNFSNNRGGGFQSNKGGTRGGRGRGRQSGKRIYCQLCGSQVILLTSAHHRFDSNFQRNSVYNQNVGRPQMVSNQTLKLFQLP